MEFELDNRAYFARYISDRGDAFYERFAERHQECLDEQAAGICVFHVVVDPDGRVIGRVNLYGLKGGSADLGYRVAERAAGLGRHDGGRDARVIALAEEAEYGLRLPAGRC